MSSRGKHVRLSEQDPEDEEPVVLSIPTDDDADEGSEDALIHTFEIESSGSPNSRADQTRLFAAHNLAIPTFYFVLGVILKFPYVGIRQYLRLELEEPPYVQILVFVIMSLPWNIKMFYGFISDCFPIYGQRRKPYMLMGSTLCAVCWCFMGLLPRPNVSLTCFFLFWAGFGMVFCDVMADTLVVERMKHELDGDVGNMQSACWICRFSGSMVGFLSSGWLMHYANWSSQMIFLANGVFPLCVLLPTLYLLRDDRVERHNTAVDEMKEKLSAIWGAVQQKHIWQPMIFVFLFAATPSNSDGFANFILGPLHFTEDEYTYVLAVGVFSAGLGAWLYRTFLKGVGWRRLFTITLLCASAVSASQLVLIFRLNRCWGISDFAFAFGDEVVMDVAGFMLQMPVLVMCAKLCPPGVESTVYALTTVVNNIALTVSGGISSALTKHYDITLTNYSSLWMMTVVASSTSLLPLLGVPFVPNRPDEVKNSPRSPIGGGVLIGGLFLGLLWSIGNAIYRISTSGGDQINDSSDEGGVMGGVDGNSTFVGVDPDEQWVWGPVYNCSAGSW